MTPPVSHSSLRNTRNTSVVEGQRHEGEIMLLHAQRREAEQRGRRRSEQRREAAKRRRRTARHTCVSERGDIGADADEGGLRQRHPVRHSRRQVERPSRRSPSPARASGYRCRSACSPIADAEPARSAGTSRARSARSPVRSAARVLIPSAPPAAEQALRPEQDDHTSRISGDRLPVCGRDIGGGEVVDGRRPAGRRRARRAPG